LVDPDLWVPTPATGRLFGAQRNLPHKTRIRVTEISEIAI
jgi:hypothetical protein